MSLLSHGVLGVLLAPIFQECPGGQSSPTTLSPWPRPPSEPHTTISGQSAGLGSHHKKECSQAIRGFWIKSNSFEVLTHIPGPREQPVLMPGAVGGRELMERSPWLLEQLCSLHKCSLPQPLKQRNLFLNTAALPHFKALTSPFFPVSTQTVSIRQHLTKPCHASKKQPEPREVAAGHCRCGAVLLGQHSWAHSH